MRSRLVVIFARAYATDAQSGVPAHMPEKRTLLTRSIGDLKNHFTIFVIEGDQQTSRDAERIAATGIQVVQINTGKACSPQYPTDGWPGVREARPGEWGRYFLSKMWEISYVRPISTLAKKKGS